MGSLQNVKNKIVVTINILPINFSTVGKVFLVRSGMQFSPIRSPMNINIAVIF
jgi:hypothetical protein